VTQEKAFSEACSSDGRGISELVHRHSGRRALLRVDSLMQNDLNRQADLRLGRYVSLSCTGMRDFYAAGISEESGEQGHAEG